MMTSEMILEIEKAGRELRSAKKRGSGVTAAKEKMKNLLLNYCDDLLALAEENKRLAEEVKVLETGLEDSDRENDELRKEIKKLKKEQAENVQAD